jgi:hypothetical protein
MIDRNEAVAAILQENASGRRWAEVNFTAVCVRDLAPTIALLTYEASARWNDEETASRTLCATVYVKVAGDWRVASHQQTIK